MARGKQIKNLNGMKFGRLTVLKQAPFKENSRHAQWFVRCECGKEKIISSANLNEKGTKSCGCLVAEINRIRLKEKSISEIGNSHWRKRDKEASFNVIYETYRRQAKKRKLIFELNKQQFKELTSSMCYYCGIRPKQSVISHKKYNGTYIYNGIDRIDCALGYIIGNCRPCCGDCNRGKFSLSEQEFLEWVERVHRWQNTYE